MLVSDSCFLLWVFLAAWDEADNASWSPRGRSLDLDGGMRRNEILRRRLGEDQPDDRVWSPMEEPGRPH